MEYTFLLRWLFWSDQRRNELVKRRHHILYSLAGLIAVLNVVFWFFGGMHLGWTRSNETRMEIDPVTTLEYPIIEKRFTPGIDFLVLGMMTSGFFSVVGYFVKPKQRSK